MGSRSPEQDGRAGGGRIQFRVGRRIPSWVWSFLEGCERKDIRANAGRNGRQGRASKATSPRHRRPSWPRSVCTVENGGPGSQHTPNDMDQWQRGRPRAARNLEKHGGSNRELENWRAPGYAEEAGSGGTTGPGTATTGLEAPSAHGKTRGGGPGANRRMVRGPGSLGVAPRRLATSSWEGGGEGWGFADGSRNPKDGHVGAAVVYAQPRMGQSGEPEWRLPQADTKADRIPMP